MRTLNVYSRSKRYVPKYASLETGHHEANAVCNTCGKTFPYFSRHECVLLDALLFAGAIREEGASP